jgi:polysaccharide export outer membrane protein
MPLIIALLLALAAQSPPAQPRQEAKPDALKGDQPRYTLGPQDQLKITVFDEPDLTNIYRIDADGFITFPMINRVAASGLTPAELQDRIRTMLSPANPRRDRRLQEPERDRRR